MNYELTYKAISTALSLYVTQPLEERKNMVVLFTFYTTKTYNYSRG